VGSTVIPEHSAVLASRELAFFLDDNFVIKMSVHIRFIHELRRDDENAEINGDGDEEASYSVKARVPPRGAGRIRDLGVMVLVML
jgi:hypothetical protein